jgi:hypothetical protein
MKARFAILALAIACVLTAGCTTPKILEQNAGSIETKHAVAQSIQAPKVDADGHIVTPWIRDAMISAFYERAAHLGLRISPQGVPVTIRISSVRSRSDAMRVVFLAADGPDLLYADVLVGDASFGVGGFTIVCPFASIATLARRVGTQSANGVAMVGNIPIAD